MLRLHCQGREKVLQKERFGRVPGQESNGEDQIILPACTYLDIKLVLVADTKQENRRKPLKATSEHKKKTRQKSKRTCLTERKLENVHKSKMTLLTTAALLQHRRTRKSLFPLHFRDCHRHRKENLAKAASSVLSSLLVFLDPPQAALLGEMSLKKTVRALKLMSLAVHKGLGTRPMYAPLLTHWTPTPSFSFLVYFQKQLISLPRKPSQRADSGLASQHLCTFPSHETTCTFYDPPEALGARLYTFHTSISFPL